MARSKHGMTTAQASAKKRKGHKREANFNKVYGCSDATINWSGASPDCEIRLDHPIIQILNTKLGISGNSVSVKGGNTIQFHLGRLPELTDESRMKVRKVKKTIVEHGISFTDQKAVLKGNAFWNKYLRKGDILVYDYDNGKRIFFNMDDVIEFICTRCTWRILETGRLKGDFVSGGSTRQFLTYEYRSKKRLFVMGAQGGKCGKRFIELLQSQLRHHIQ